MERKLFTTLIAGMLALAIACSGSKGSQASNPMPTNGAVVLSGPVSGTAGALVFAGQPLSTGGAVVTDQGSPATNANLKSGSIIQGTAIKSTQGFQLQAADVRHALEGLISSVDLAGSKLVVMGQTVMLDALTVIEQEVPGGPATALTLADLKVGDLIEVDGTTNTDGSLQATRIEREPATPTPDFFLRGVVSGLDTTAKTFQIGGFTVSYGSAMITGTLANGAQVVVHGTISGTTFTATRVRVQVDMDAPGSTLEVSGPISALDTTAMTFTLMSYTVNYGTAKVRGTLANGAQVEVEGTTDTTGKILTAAEVEVAFAHGGSGASNGRVVGTVSAVSATDMTLTIGGVTFWTDSSTVFMQGWKAATLAAVPVGTRVEVHFLSTKTNTAGQAYATKVEILPLPM